MPKAERYFVEGKHYHLTHRCHNRSFLFRFAKDRDVYREMLRQRLLKYKTPLLGYCITSNHVHLLVTAMSDTRVSELMESLEGDFAQYYNLRKRRSGAFWGTRFHAVAVEDGGYLWRCLNYIDLNMVRAGVVNHPSEWRWCSYNEIMGNRQRYRLVDTERIATLYGDDWDAAAFKENYCHSIEEKIRGRAFNRNAIWSESLAIGGAGFVRDIEERIYNRRQMDCAPANQEDSGTWILKEERPAYA